MSVSIELSCLFTNVSLVPKSGFVKSEVSPFFVT